MTPDPDTGPATRSSEFEGADPGDEPVGAVMELAVGEAQHALLAQGVAPGRELSRSAAD